MSTKEKAIHFYEIGLYTAEQLHKFVPKFLTEEEYNEVVGE